MLSVKTQSTLNLNILKLNLFPFKLYLPLEKSSILLKFKNPKCILSLLLACCAQVKRTATDNKGVFTDMTRISVNLCSIILPHWCRWHNGRATLYWHWIANLKLNLAFLNWSDTVGWIFKQVTENFPCRWIQIQNVQFNFRVCFSNSVQ